MKGISVLLVDDHEIIRQGLKAYLKDVDRLEVVGESENGEAALTWLKGHTADVIITDISMPVMDGIEFTRRCKLIDFNQKILALSMLNDNYSIKKIIGTGANGYILKTCSRDEFITSIIDVYNGKSVYSKEVTDSIMDNLLRKKSVKQESVCEIPLSKRETEVLMLICVEKTNREIANELFISIRTVESHKRNLLEKTGCKNIAGLVIYALERNLIN